MMFERKSSLEPTTIVLIRSDLHDMKLILLYLFFEVLTGYYDFVSYNLCIHGYIKSLS